MIETPLSLLNRLRRKPGDQPSWRRLTTLYAPLIRRWLLQQDTPESDVDDLTQEVLLALTRDLADFDHNGRKGAFRHWVRSITTNRLRGYWRNRRSGPLNGLEVRLAQLEDPSSELCLLWDREHDEYIARRLMELIEPEFALSTWRSFQLLVLEERPAAAVAEQLGLSVNAVLIAKSRVLRRLRQEGRGLIG
ncbi:RNA polymerase sigma factor [Tundrisphaera lichenicola]|uniref:RNA polymerase sigma factor n=1 Tax=Tundrisphaera lichenicola TaxID=2029860 RepID=UPI003EB71A9C